MRIVIIDDHELMRRGLTLLLSTAEGVEVVGEAADGLEGLAVIAARHPDVVLTDARMPRMGGVEVVTSAREQFPGLPVIILTTFDEADLVREAISAGAAGFLLKDTSTDDLVHAIHSAYDGGLVIDPRVARAALFSTPRHTAPEPLAVLTRAERLVAEQLATGATNGEIAGALVLAEGTVKNHISTILRKLQQRDRTALALYLSRTLEEGVASG
ncbi:response regulator [Actinomycetota bacterium]